MSQYLPEPRNGLFPSRIGHKLEKAFEHQEAHALVAKRSDQLRIERVEEAAARGLVAVAQISSLEASLVRAAPHAEGRLRAIADAGTIGIVGIVARSGF
jgi:hypothetical protein